jgi:hypothetical protein
VSARATPVEAVLIGAGVRGTFAYGAFAEAHPEHVRFVAVAEPDPARRARWAALHITASHSSKVVITPRRHDAFFNRSAMCCRQRDVTDETKGTFSRCEQGPLEAGGIPGGILRLSNADRPFRERTFCG